MKYRIEMIPKKSVMDEIIDYWVASGRTDNTPDGVFVFEEVDSYEIDGGSLLIRKDETYYAYNLADWYRIKATPAKQGSLI
jgi:hypothetical protein